VVAIPQEVGTVEVSQPPKSVRLGLLMPGDKCDLCGKLLLFSGIANRLGQRYCLSHSTLPLCHLCSGPHHAGGDFCEPCAATCVRSQDELRVTLPRIRDELHAMGIRLNPPVHVQLVDEVTLAAKNTGPSDQVHGVTVTSGRRALEIYVLEGQPAMEFAAIVAHECMHAWLAQNGFSSGIDRQIEEGLCQVVSYRCLRDQADPRARLVLENIELSPDPVYGGGFRLVRDSVRRHGMESVLAAVKATGHLP